MENDIGGELKKSYELLQKVERHERDKKELSKLKSDMES